MSQNYPFGQSHTNLESPSKRPADYLLITLSIAAVVSTLLAVAILSAFLVTTLVNLPWTDYLPGVETFPSDRQFLVAGAAFLIGTLIFLVLFRWRLKRNQSYQFVNGCPSCGQYDMIRVHRQQYQRIISQMLKISLRSYACRNCRWQGVLVYSEPQKLSGAPLPTMPKQKETARQEGGGTEPAESFTAGTESTLSFEAQEEMEAKGESIQICDKVETADSDEEEAWQARPEEVRPTAQDQREVSELFPQEYLLPARDSSAATINQNKTSPNPNADSPASDEAGENDEVSGAETEDTIMATDEKGAADRGIVGDEIKKLPSLANPPIDHGPVEPGEETVIKAIVVAPFGLSLRSAPDSKAEIIYSLAPDALVEVLDLDTTDSPVNWRQVRFEGQVGWAAAAFLRYLQA